MTSDDISSFFSVAGVVKDQEKDCWVFTDGNNDSLPCPEEATPRQSSKRKKRAKRKSHTSMAKKKLTWGHVHEYLFHRSISFDSIPSNGLFPLGLGDFVEEYCFPISETKSEEATGAKDDSEFSSLQEKDRVIKLKDMKHSREASEVNRSIRLLRESRLKVGCDCKPIKIDKLNVAKLKSEIRHRSTDKNPDELQDIESLKKNELVKVLRDLLKNCKTCIDQNCECVANGISCSPLVCSCVRSHAEESETPEGHESTAKDDQTCGNPNGEDVLNVKNVQLYRSKYVQSPAILT